MLIYDIWALPQWLIGKETAYNVGDRVSIRGSGRSAGEENGNLLQYSCLGNAVDRGAWRARVHGVTKVLDRTKWLNKNHNDVSMQYLGHIYTAAATAAAKSLQLCPTPCDPIDGSPPGSPVPGILQARTLEWVAISFSNACKWKVKVRSLSRVWLLATPWTAAYQAPPSMGFSRQEYWSGEKY